MTRLLFDEKLFEPYEYLSEAEFERDIVKHAKQVFGEHSLYFDVKRRIGTDNIVTIPDGYLVDFFFESDPRLYIVENELSSHDPYKHIGQQLLRFAISYKSSGRLIKSFLLEQILADKTKVDFANQRLQRAGYRNVDDLLEDLIFEKPVAAIVLIDEATEDLQNVLAQLTMKADVLEFRPFVCGNETIYGFTPFQQELRSISEKRGHAVDIEELDTIVVPANEEGFQETFLGENCWYAIRMSSAMIDRVKYIAAYQTAPISAITHWAEIARIEKYKKTNKYILFFKNSAKKISPVKLPEGKKRGMAPQAPRYTSFRKLRRAKVLSDIF
jgi:hypothetical protein